MRVRAAVLDRLIAVGLTPVVGPVVAVLSVLVRREDGPPSLIGLARAGRGGRQFRMWKVRTMRAEGVTGAANGAVITSGDDDRVTSVGARLRRARLDEFPQLWNVIVGDMAIFGPRPETPSMVDLDDPRWRAVLAARPGITGPTQLVVEHWESELLAAGSQESRYRNEILPVKLAVDRWYVEHASPRIDALVAWSMIERFGLGRHETAVEARVRREVPETSIVPRHRVDRGD
jgi:lipopolysaccharide/colanic/teichoic acid biosynthesis glycosyltransferase